MPLQRWRSTIPVPGEGPMPSPVMMIGEAPGAREMSEGRPFVGKSGRELTVNLERAGLDRSKIRITNLVKEQPPYTTKQQPPTAQMIEHWTPSLLDELCATQPRWIGAIGRYAARFLIGRDIDMESSHAMAFPLRPELQKLLRADQFVARRIAAKMQSGNDGFGAYTDLVHDAWIPAVRVVPLYHPAAGLHNPDVQPLVWYDIQQFGKYANGRLRPQTPVDLHPHPSYLETDALWRHPVRVVGIDTEGDRANPWSLQLAARPGSARVLLGARRQRWLGAVRRLFAHADKLVFQHALHDEDVLDALGLQLDWPKVEDIYIAADVLRLVPRGLKAGALRDCGMKMRAYTEVVAPAEKRLAREYVDAAIGARVCYTCFGAGKLVDEAKLQRRKPGREYKTVPMLPCPDCVEGGLWEPRASEVTYDWNEGEWKMSRGWEVQHYLRVLAADIEAGKFDDLEAAEDAEGGDDKDAADAVDSPRKRFGNWPGEVQRQIESALGTRMPVATLEDIDRKEAVEYAGRDADATLRRYPILMEQIRELGLYDAYRLDVDVLPVAAAIQRNGMHIDRNHFARFSEELRERKERVADELQQLLGRRINPASGDQVAEVFFGKMRLEYTDEDARTLQPNLSFELTPEKYTSSGKRGATDEKTLEGLKLKYPHSEDIVRACELILDFRMCDKLDGTYVRKLPRYVDANDRVHPKVKIGPATFRWALADPPLHQIPTREKHGEKLGRRVREGFTAPPGRVLIARDFDQIEMRVLAWYAQDETLLNLFAGAETCPVARDASHPLHYKGKCRCHDPHFITGHRVFRTPLEAVTKDQRDSSKNIGFGIVYGVTPRGLKAQMDLRGQNWTEDECAQLIDLYLYDAFPGVGRFIMDAHAEARRYNMVRSMLGHIRYTPAVHSSIPSIREEALRQAANYKIQSTAAELLKIAERDLYRDCGERFEELDAKLVLSMHDELVVECPDDEDTIFEVDALMATYMTNPYPLDGVEITSGSKVGRNWAETKG